MRAGWLSHYPIIVEVMYILYAETKLLMLLVECTLLKMQMKRLCTSIAVAAATASNSSSATASSSLQL